MPTIDPGYESWKGQSVEFYVRDVHLPPPSEVLEDLYGGDRLEGTVVDVCDGGRGAGVFVVVRVDRLRKLCIVAAERILGVV